MNTLQRPGNTSRVAAILCMRLLSIRLQSFRAHHRTSLDFTPKVTVLHGPNGAGKTNILEAIHYLCLGKSFLSGSEAHALRHGEPHFELEGKFSGEKRADLRVRMAYVPDSGKRLELNGVPLDRLADIVGTLPVVVLAPEDYVLTAGPPEERRRFLDNTLSQSRPAYMNDLIRYRRTMRQRNALLMMARQRQPVDPAALAAWTSELAQLGGRIIYRRHKFVRRFSNHLEKAYEPLAAVNEHPSIEYQTVFPINDEMTEEDTIAELEGRLFDISARERDKGRTLIGPHRDDLVFRIESMEIRSYASQGQHRTFALALKLATFSYLREILDETPLLLLDDVFGILDPERSHIILKMLETDAVGQSIITAARKDVFDGVIDFESNNNQAMSIDS